MTEHWSTPNGCHSDCPVCAADVAAAPVVEYDQHSAVLSNSRVVTVVRDNTMGNHAVYVGNAKRWSAQVIDVGTLEHVLGSSPFMLRSASVTLSPDVKFPDTLDACMALDTDAGKPDAAVRGFPAGVVTVVRDTVSRRVAVYVGGNLLRTDSYLFSYAGEPPMSVTMETSLKVYGEFPKQLCDVEPLCAVEFSKVGTEPTPEKAAEPAKPSSREWATSFVEKYKRFPHAIDYADAGFGTDSQCDCTNMSECVLRDAFNRQHCDRNCYTQQLKDYIVMSSTKRAEPKQEDRPATVEDLLSRISKLESQCRNNGKVPAIVRIPLWAEGLLLQGVHNTDVRRELRWRAGSWRPHAIWGLQCIWETEELVVE